MVLRNGQLTIGYLFWQKGGCPGKTIRKARSVATGVTLQRGSGTSQKKCGYRLRSPDNAPCVQRNETWQLGEFEGSMQEGRKAGKPNGPLKGFGVGEGGNG